MTPRTAWIGCAAAGVAAFSCSWLFGRIPGLVACGPTGGFGPIIGFELARTPAAIAAIFGSDPCTTTLVAAQRTALWLDGLGFIPAYTAFLIFAIAALSRGWPKWLAIAIVANAGLDDQIEGYMLGRILDTLPGTQAQVDALFWVVHIKFASLALATLWIAALLLATRRRSGAVASLAVGIGGLTACAGFVAGPSPVMMTGFAFGWVSLLLTALVAVWRPSLVAPSNLQAVHPARPPAPAMPSA